MSYSTGRTVSGRFFYGRVVFAWHSLRVVETALQQSLKSENGERRTGTALALSQWCCGFASRFVRPCLPAPPPGIGSFPRDRHRGAAAAQYFGVF